MEEGSGRPIKTRSAGWARGLAARLASGGVTPNGISGLSVVFAAAGAMAFVGGRAEWMPWMAGWLVGAVMVQMRLICNLMDGMVAIEGGKKSATGDLWNEIPDRFADGLLLVGAGWAAGVPWWGVGAAWAAVMTAYVRETGAALIGEHDFCGPFAKPQRMALLTVAAIVTAFDVHLLRVMEVAMIIIAVGTGLTVVRRMNRLAGKMKSRGS